MRDGSVAILCGHRSGFLPAEWGCGRSVPVFSIQQILVAIGLPVWLFVRSREPRHPRPRPETLLLIVVLAVATLLFTVAHLRLFELHLPSRYSQMLLRATTLLALGMVLALWFERGLRWAGPVAAGRLARRQWVVMASALLAILGLLIMVIPNWFAPKISYIQGRQPDLYAFFAQQPKDSLIASLSREADNLPTFAQRSVLTAREYSIPYSLGYIEPLRARTGALIKAFFHPDIEVLQSFLAEYGVDFVLVDRIDFKIDDSRWWARDYPRETADAVQMLRQSGKPAIIDFLDQCAVFENRRFLVLPTECIAAGP